VRIDIVVEVEAGIVGKVRGARRRVHMVRRKCKAHWFGALILLPLPILGSSRLLHQVPQQPNSGLNRITFGDSTGYLLDVRCEQGLELPLEIAEGRGTR
jgi:hypothetical protein